MMFKDIDIKYKGNLPVEVVSKANTLLQEAANRASARKLMIHKHKNGKSVSIRVGNRYRLFKRNTSNRWELLSHESYNNRI